MSDTMFRDQREIDAFDERLYDIHEMWRLHFADDVEATEIIKSMGHSPIMARRVIELWKPFSERLITNVY